MSDVASPPIAAAPSPAVLNNLALYQLQRPFIEPMLRACRFTNTALGALFYDVGVLTVTLLAKSVLINTGAAGNALRSGHPQHKHQQLHSTEHAGRILHCAALNGARHG
jgi:hypothetical protein